jgi:hypothetical protein
MYMGPSMSPEQESAFMQSPAGTRVNLMPPPTAPSPSRLEQAQALDRPGDRTLSIRSEPPYSDASLAAQKNRMTFEAIQKFNAGDKSPEVLAAALGTIAGYQRPRPKTPVNPARWVPANPATGAPGYFESGTGTVHVPPTPKVVPPQMSTETLRYSAKPAVPGSPEHRFLGIGPRVPAVPDIPEQPARTVTRKVPDQTTPITPPKVEAGSKGPVSKEQAREFLRQAGGDKDKARKLARDAGYEL